MATVEWTQEENEQLYAYWNDEMTTAKIAELMGKTKNAIIGRANRDPKCKVRAVHQTKAYKAEQAEKLANETRTLDKVETGQCVFPISGTNGRDDPFIFCGDPIDKACPAPYCTDHYKDTYWKLDPNKKRKPVELRDVYRGKS